MFWQLGTEIVTSESPMQLEIKLWWLKFLNWSPVGKQSFPQKDPPPPKWPLAPSKSRVQKSMHKPNYIYLYIFCWATCMYKMKNA